MSVGRELPRALFVPSGRRVHLAVGGDAAPTPRASDGASLLDRALALFDEGVITARADDGEVLDARALALGDFHVLAAVAARAGLLEEAEVDISCANCGAPMRVRPCDALEIGPFVDGELSDPDADATEPFDAPLDVAPILVGPARQAQEITLAARRTVDAIPLFSWANIDSREVSREHVEALGLRAIGDVTDGEELSRVLSSCGPRERRGVAEAWHAAHYTPRLVASVRCDACHARADIDAPYERELTAWLDAPAPPGATKRNRGFPKAETFSARALAIADDLVSRLPPLASAVEIIADDAAPEVDEGGVPLMGGYVPPSDIASHGTVTVYYRTFRDIWEEEGPYAWEDELRETIAHELEHHAAFLRGHDEVDDDEREQIRAESAALVGHKESARRTRANSAAAARDFWRRTWPLWVLVLAATVYTCLANR